VKKAMALPGRSRETIPAHVYGANQMNAGPVETGAAWVGIGVRKGVPDEVVYRATKAFWDHIDELYAQGEALKNVSLANALKHMPTPLHPGALRYYREKGVAIPPELIAQN
jgi:TRAP transporter TAXI family solute receptor